MTDYHKKYRDVRIAAGLCRQCGKRPPLEGIVRCEPCRDYNRAAAARQRRALGMEIRGPAHFAGLTSLEYVKALKMEQRSLGLCESGRCKSVPEPGHYQCRPHLDKVKANNYALYAKRKAAGQCRQCGEVLEYRITYCERCRPSKTGKPPQAVQKAIRDKLRTERLAALHAAAQAQVDFIKQHLYLVPARSREIMRRRYGPDAETLQEVAGTLNLTRERVRQIQALALHRILSTPERWGRWYRLSQDVKMLSQPVVVPAPVVDSQMEEK